MSTAPKMQTKRSLLNQMNKELEKIGQNPSLQDWLEKTAKIDPCVAKAIEGIYCGRDGRIHVEVEGLEHSIWLTMGWHTVSTARVEYAYFS